MKLSVVLFVLVFFISFASSQRTSLLGALTERGLLVSSEQSSEPTLVEGFDITQEHALELANADGSSTPLWLWLAQNEGQDFTPYVSVGYRGELTDASAEAFGYLYGFVGTRCFGFEMEQTNDVVNFVVELLPTFSDTWTSDTRQFGDVNITVGGQIAGEELSIVIDYQHFGAPGMNGWELACALE